jgi:hypothetical protein
VSVARLRKTISSPVAELRRCWPAAMGASLARPAVSCAGANDAACLRDLAAIPLSRERR